LQGRRSRRAACKVNCEAYPCFLLERSSRALGASRRRQDGSSGRLRSGCGSPSVPASTTPTRMYADIGITQTESSQRPCVDNQEIDNDCDNDYDYEGQLRVMAELRSSQAAGQAVPPYPRRAADSNTATFCRLHLCTHLRTDSSSRQWSTSR